MASAPSIRDHRPVPETPPETAKPSKHRYHLDTRVFTVFLFVAMPFVAFGSFIVVSTARGMLQESIGTSLEQRALETKLLLERYVGDQIAALHLLSLDPQVRTALAAAPQQKVDAQAVEQAWAVGSDSKLLSPVLETPLARRLRDYIQIRPAVRLLQVVDSQGRVVASSSRAGRYLHTDEGWFKSITRNPYEPQAYVGDIQRPAGRTTPLLEVAYSIHDNESGQWAGAVRALVDATDLYSVIAPVRVGRTGHAVLLRAADGMILASDETARMLKDSYVGFSAIKAAQAEKRGYWIIPPTKTKTPEGAEGETVPGRLVGYSSVDQVPNVSWLVAVEQSLEEATAPIEAVTKYLWWHFIGAFATIILLALYFSFKLETPVIEADLHLHEDHVPPQYRQES